MTARLPFIMPSMLVAMIALGTAQVSASTGDMLGACDAIGDKFGVTATFGSDFEGLPPSPVPGMTAPALSPLCRIEGVASPVEGSRIGYEVWLPANGWNGRLQMIGNGGYSSSISYFLLQLYASRGYAVVATDTGHTGDDPDFAKGRYEAIVDWGHRAVHVSVGHAKTLVRAFYGRDADYSYFAGCSTGGHQALMEVQRYPDDFDGVLAGAPGHNRTHLNVGFLWQFVQNHRENPEEPTIPASKLPAVAARALASCGTANGAEAGGLKGDQFLNDPLSCQFDPAEMQCEAEDGPDCLTAPQVAALRAMYDGARNPVTGERIYFGFLPGSEASGGPAALPGWSLYWADPTNPKAPARASFWQYWAFDNTDWRWTEFDFNKDVAKADAKLAPLINAMSPDLSAFRARGGKLIQYHGLADPVVPATDSVHYFTRVQQAMGGDAGDFHRLFLVPGMHHCYGGPGPFDLNAQAALEDWVERDRAPHFLTGKNPGSVAAKPYSRKICPFPEKTVFDGKGDPLSADSFMCRPSPVPKAPEIGQAYLR
ncbi:tannase/feruloyl esterase family alpha/beta hydrolase [Pseudokordiimonas caeni]|uniref:tannase/feruloyl esterase family alpha/beta hydrolase n=1 Tax=Pseudokordiimonas caeni TaxID=2997908 RepID=UPI00281161D2|nr:tannase/feruloyl esterase family alpha/beta hydrolase [Pseudokordiimonas caeni]